jgi:predicted phosphodiesterase
MTSHDLVAELIRLAQELQRIPLRDEFVSRIKGGRGMVDKHFGSYRTLLQAAGLADARRIDNSVFERDIERHLEQHRPITLPDVHDYESTLFIPDVHFPFEHADTLAQIYEFAERHQPKNIVQLGDLYDMYSHAKFPRSHNVFTPREEFSTSRKKAELFWKTLRLKAPKARCVQITGNHCVRPVKRIIEVYPEAEDWIVEIVEKMMTFDGVESITDPRQELILPGNICVIHGYRSNLGAHRDYTMMNVVCGHTHRGGVVYRQVRGEIIWELNAGLAGDATAKGLSYTSQRVVDWTLGWGYLDEYGPRFIPARGK